MADDDGNVDVDLAIGDADLDVDTEVDDRTAKLLRAVRAENAKRRVQNRELSATLSQLQADLEAVQSRMAEYQAIADKTNAELEAERAARQKELEALTSANEKVIASLPDRLQRIVPRQYDPFNLREWLDAAVPELVTKTPAIDGVAGSKPDRQSDQAAVTAEVATMAQALGVDPQQLIKNLKR